MSVIIYSNPGNASLWALLSRVIPQYYPRKANVSLFERKALRICIFPDMFSFMRLICVTRNAGGY